MSAPAARAFFASRFAASTWSPNSISVIFEGSTMPAVWRVTVPTKAILVPPTSLIVYGFRAGVFVPFR